MRLTIVAVVIHVVRRSVHDDCEKNRVKSEERLLSFEVRDEIIKRLEPSGIREETRECENQREIDYKCNQYGFQFNLRHLLYHSAMFFAEAPACHHPEGTLPPLKCPCCACGTLCCHLLLHYCGCWNWYKRLRCIVWDKDRATPSRLELKCVLAVAESGSLKLAHCCLDFPHRLKSGEFITYFLSPSRFPAWYKKSCTLSNNGYTHRTPH